MDKKNETVTISKEEYDSLVEDSLFLECLQGAGVDNWEGYDAAIEMMDAQKSDPPVDLCCELMDSAQVGASGGVRPGVR